MNLEGKVNSASHRLLNVVRNITAIVAVCGVLAGSGFLIYVGTGINKENIKQTVVLEGTGQRIDYRARTPREGLWRLVPWNDDNGHAIMSVYDLSGVKVLRAVDEDYNGNLLDERDELTVHIDGKTVKCFLNKAINSKGEEVAFVGSDDPIINAMFEGARNYCSANAASANTLYLQTRRQLNR